MEDWGITVNSNINEMLETVLHGKNTQEEREEALISFIKDYDKSANECYVELRTRAIAKNSVIFIAAIISAILGAAIAALLILA